MFLGLLILAFMGFLLWELNDISEDLQCRMEHIRVEIKELKQDGRQKN